MADIANSKISLSYVIPVYNEEEILEQVLTSYIRDFDSMSSVIREFELIVVDDASKDRSYEIATAFAHRDNRVKVIRHERNQGVGCGILTGFDSARMEWVSLNCADRPFDVKDVETFSRLFSDNDMIVVQRACWSRASWYRTLTSWVNYALIRILFAVPVKDYQFVQFYRKDMLCCEDVMSRGTLVPPEMIMRMYKSGARIAEVSRELHRRPGGKAKYGHPKHVMKALWEMVKLRVSLWFESKDKSHLRSGQRSADL